MLLRRTGYNIFTGLTEETFNVFSEFSGDVKWHKQLPMCPKVTASEDKEGGTVTDTPHESPASDYKGTSEVSGNSESTESKIPDEESQRDTQSMAKDSNKGKTMETDLP
jgi:hypothetical protein